MNNIIDVQSGEVRVGGKGVTLRAAALGSCVAVAAYDPKKKIGALAHIMLPGRAPELQGRSRSTYAADAIDEMIDKMVRSGAAKDDIQVCLVGGANVLEDKYDTVCEAIVNSVTGILKEKGIRIAAKAVGGTTRRSVSFDAGSGNIHYLVGDGKEEVLCRM